MSRDQISIKKSWARKINSIDTLPNYIMESIKETGISTANYLNAVYAPRTDEANELLSEDVILLTDNSVKIFIGDGSTVKTTSFSYENIIRVELGIILLKSWLRIDSKATTHTIYFNTTTEALFHEILEQIRFKIHKDTSKLRKHATTELDYLKDLNLKLYNYSHHTLLEKDEIIDSVYQERNMKYDINPSISILTHNELIFIKEPHSNQTPEESMYGGIWEYIPIKHIKDITTKDSQNKILFDLNIAIGRNTMVTEHYTHSTKGAFKSFDSEIRNQLWH